MLMVFNLSGFEKFVTWSSPGEQKHWKKLSQSSLYDNILPREMPLEWRSRVLLFRGLLTVVAACPNRRTSAQA